jgi:capsular polysaccharide export protein
LAKEDLIAGVGGLPRRLFYFNAGFLWQKRVRRILALSGYELCLGRPGPDDGVVVWGHSPYAWRGEKVAAKYGLPLVRIEDAFMRSLRPGRMGDAPLGLLIDGDAVHFNGAGISRIEEILARDPLDDLNILERARIGISRMRDFHLSKYNMHDPYLAAPPAGYVLVIDQTRGDASIRYSAASEATFAEMLALAVEENPGQRIVIKTHPETQAGLRAGHFSGRNLPPKTVLCADPVSPWPLLEGAIAVYTVSSQLGFEAILAGHKPHVFGQPFYAGWGLSLDRQPVARRQRKLTQTQLFAAAMIHAPKWYDPGRDQLCRFEDALNHLEAEVRAWREDRAGYTASGMRLWKRGALQRFYGRQTRLRFLKDADQAQNLAQSKGQKHLIWANSTPPKTEVAPVSRIEDGFLRSRGLGAELIPPLSLVADDLGIYYDPNRESRLERLILAPCPVGGEARARALVAQIRAAHVSKYNLGGALPDLTGLPPGPRILVPGQVEDDASIRLGAGDVRTNLDLLRATRAANPRAAILYKPHPDVEAGLRPGAIAITDLNGLADLVAQNSDPLALIDAVDQVWTMTSLLGFEALLRGKSVSCLGAPFYAGWGLTQDLGPTPARRSHAEDGHPLPRPGLWRLAHAVLIAYPRYVDPRTQRPCPPETAVARLAIGNSPPTGLSLRLLAKAQGLLASYAYLWRG